MSRSPSFWLCLAVVSSVPALAAPPAGQDTEVTVEDIPTGQDAVVHSQVASFAVTPLRDSPGVVTAVTADEIRSSGARDLMDVLLLVPGFFFGVDVVNVVGVGFRGLWGHEGKVLLLVDGKEMNEVMYSTLQFGNEFPVELIERVEVVRGPGSAMYGGNAELAVINVITRGLQGSTDALVGGTVGVLGSARRSALVSGRLVADGVPGLSAFVSASIGAGVRSDQQYADASGTLAQVEDNPQLDPAVVQAGVGYRDLQLSLLYHRYLVTSVDGYGDIEDPAVRSDFESFHAELIHTFRPSERWAITPRLNLSLQEPWRDTNPDSNAYYYKQVRRLRGRLTGRWAPWDQLQLTAGGDVALDHAFLVTPDDQDPFTDTDGPTVDYVNLAAFFEGYWDTPWVDVVAGARFDRHTKFGNSLVPRVVLTSSFGDFSAKALYSRAFRAPGIENINFALGTITPERTEVWEVELGYQIAEGHRVSLNAFDVGIDNTIVYTVDYTDDPEGVDVYANLGRHGSRGFELDYRIKGPFWRGQLSYGFYSSTSTDIAEYHVDGHDDVYAGMPAHRLTVTGGVKVLPWLSVNPTAILVSERFDVNALDPDGNAVVGVLPGAVLLNLVVRAQDLGVRGLDVSAGVYNLFGAPMRLAQPYTGGHAPLPALDREFMVRATYYFDTAAR